MPDSSSPHTFELGLVLAGAISAGAYTAGVIDFLMEALDAWEAAKAAPGYDGPEHAVRLKAISGASAGSMTAAIAAVALGGETEPVHDVDHPPPPERNRLFDSWVRRIDIGHLLAARDLKKKPPRVTSLLDSTELEAIAHDALHVAPRPAARPYVLDPLPIFLTIANLRGVPYGFHLADSGDGTLYGMLCHADHMAFALTHRGVAPDGMRPLDPAAAPDGNWQLLATAALASGAFPVGLRSRELFRPYLDYRSRFERKPDWPSPVLQTTPPWEYRFLCVDGGLMNNEPFELTRRYLANGGQNERSGEHAHRAVIMVDPFPNASGFKQDWEPDDRLTAVARSMFSALVNQARFKLEELELAEHPDVYSRYAVSPTRKGSDGVDIEPAIASAILRGFGGFLAEDFRKHDFQLGRRNCQQFLRRHFAMPETNELFSGWPEEVRQVYCVKERDGEPQRYSADRPARMLPIVPLMPGVADEIPLPPPPKAEAVDVQVLADVIEQRIRIVGAAFIETEAHALLGSDFVRWTARKILNWRLAPGLRDRALAIVEEELARLH